MRQQSLILFFIITVLASCSKSVVVPEVDEPVMAFVSHTRVEAIGVVNPQLSYVDWMKYPILLLGGDLDKSTTSHDSIINSYNEIFDLSNSKTLWAIGNHDLTDQGLIDDYTQKDKSHFFIDENIAVFTLNNINSNGVISAGAISLLQDALPLITSDHTLIIITHKLIWLAGNSSLSGFQEGLANGEMGTCLHCTPSDGNFNSDLYPILTQLESEGVDVICLAGDLGSYESYFEYETEEGVVLLANGFNKESVENEFLEFYFENDKLVWEVVKVESFK